MKPGRIREEEESFNNVLKQEPYMIGNKVGITGEELLRMFLYGFGLFHWCQQDPRDRKLAEQLRAAVTAYGREHVIMAFQTTLQHLVGHAIRVYHVVGQDLTHWTDAQKYAGPARISIRDLMG